MKLGEIGYTIRNHKLGSIARNAFSYLVSDAHVVSYRKSGRTWLRMMLGRVISLKYNIPHDKLETQFMTLFKSAPNVVFSHAGCTKSDNKIDFRRLLKRKKIVFLVRDPKDDIVSLYNDYVHRAQSYTKSISEFVRDEKQGIMPLIRYMNGWVEEMERRSDDFLLVKYEDMKEDPARELKRVVRFLEIDVSDEVIADAVEYSSFQNMRKMEVQNTFKDARMRTKDTGNVNAFKTRKGKVGSYKEELSQEDITFLEQEIGAQLHPTLGY